EKIIHKFDILNSYILQDDILPQKLSSIHTGIGIGIYIGSTIMVGPIFCVDHVRNIASLERSETPGAVQYVKHTDRRCMHDTRYFPCLILVSTFIYIFELTLNLKFISVANQFVRLIYTAEKKFTLMGLKSIDMQEILDAVMAMKDGVGLRNVF
ncbi:hypothetical protein ACJX0J_015251, partial [Zea mays]